MTDKELIARLREGATWDDDIVAADRIEALVDEVERLGKQCEGLMQAALGNGQALILAEAKVEKLVEALRLARVHVANNAQGWSVSRAPSRDDLTIIDAALAEIEGEK